MAGKNEYEVKKGQDLYTIAKMHDTTWQILAQLNKSTIKDPDKIVPGQFIKVPPMGSSLTGKTNERPDSLTSQTNHKVKKGETLSGISQRSGVSVEQLQLMNRITNPTTLQAGQTIKLRSDGSAQTHTTPKPSPTARPTPKQSSNPSSSDEDEGFFSGLLESIEDGLGALGDKAKEGLEGINDAMSGGKNDKPTGGATAAGTDSNSNASSTLSIYTIKSGDTLSGIAKKHGVNMNDLARINSLKLTDTIHPGDKLKIPSNGTSSSSTGSSSQSSRTDVPVNVITKPSNSSDGAPKAVATTNGACICKAHNLFWSAKVSCEFRKKVIEICQDLWPNDYLAMANNLMALMHLETEGTFDPSKVNSLGFVGLVQMGAGAREDLNVSKDKLRNMSAVEQLDWVKRYFQLYNNRYKKIDSFLEMYLTILRPASVKPEGIDIDDNEIIFKDNGQAKGNPYRQNPAFMKEKGELKVRGFSGGVTYAWEVKKEIAHHYNDGKKPENRVFKPTCEGVIQKPQTNTGCRPLSAKNEKKVEKLHPKIRCSVRDFINDSERELGIKLIIVQGLRTYEEQNKLYAKGRTASGSIVTKAKGGQSNHNFGVAIDVFPLHEDGKLHMADDKKNIRLLKKVAPIGKRHGFKWGGDWTSFKDYPHFENMYGKTLSQLRNLYGNANGNIEKVSL